MVPGASERLRVSFSVGVVEANRHVQDIDAVLAAADAALYAARAAGRDRIPAAGT